MKFLKRLWYFVFLIILICFTYYKIFGYTFWRDDVPLFMAIPNNDPLMFNYFIHPGTLGEFFLLKWLFGSHLLWWNSFGICLKIFGSYSVFRFIRGLTRSDTIGKIAGLFFAATPIGLESVGWSSAHIVLLDTLFFSYAMAYFIEYQKEKSKKGLIYYVFFTFFSFVSDPVRAFPLIPLFFIYKILFHPFSSQKTIKRIALIIVLFSIVFIALFVVANFRMVVDTRIIQAILRHGWDVMFYIKRTVWAFFVLFSSFGSIFIGWIIQAKDDVGYSDPSFIGFIGGCIPFIVLFVLWKEMAVKTYRMIFQKKIILFLLLWVYLFYLPNWIFNIVMTPGFTNRYLVVSSVGYVALLAVCITSLPSYTWKRVLLVSILCIQMFISFSINWKNDVFRSNEFLPNTTEKMNKEVLK